MINFGSCLIKILKRRVIIKLRSTILYGLFCLTLVESCSVAKFLPPGERLYRGATIKVAKDKDVETSRRSLKKQIQPVARPRPNKFFLGQPYKVWWWYVIGQPKKQKGFKVWLRNTLGEPPVLSSSVNWQTTAENMSAFLENEGYFHSSVTGDTIHKNYFTKAIYSAHVLPQYTVNNITWVNDSSNFLQTLISANPRQTLLKSGKPYRLQDIEAERNRLDLFLKTKGYYFFNPNYIMAYADSTVGNRQVNLLLSVKNTMPKNAKYAYTINRITIFPNYTLLQPPPDTGKIATLIIDGLLIRDTIHNFKPRLFAKMITYRPGSLYNTLNQNTTLNRLINLGTFKFVRHRFEAVKNLPDSHKLNVYYYLTPAKKKSLQAEVDAFSKENRFIGTQLSVNWINRNTFRSAEQLSVRAYGGFEISFRDSLKKNNNFRIGGDVSFNFPRFLTPFFKLKESRLYPPRTQILLGYQYFIKQRFYSTNFFRLQYEFNWKDNANKQHILDPVFITYSNAGNISDSFYKAAVQRPAVLLNLNSEVIVGSYYNFTYNTLNPFINNQWYFNGSIDLSGNIAGLITGAKKMREKMIFNIPFAQYAKFDFDVRYKRVFNNNLEWANRLQIGIGMPYHNSAMLPFTKQYVIGGANSIRGFPARTLGPGSYLPTTNDLRFFQVIGGDYKLLVNTELRFPIWGRFKGALFTDVGNIWTKDTILFGMPGKLKKDSYKELAVAAGFGIRFDAKVILIRADLGIPLRKPFLSMDQRWGFKNIALADKVWRRENLILNIAIGYPF